MSISNPPIKVILEKTIPYLAEKGLPNPRLEADLMLAAVLDLPRVKLYSQWDRPLEPRELQRYREFIVKRVQGWPLAYLTGKKAFLSWEFEVTPQVLIPRPETELLVEMTYNRLKNLPGAQGADIGVGSGVIVVSLAKLLPESHWFGVDISAAALEVASGNAAKLGVSSQIDFIRGDLLEPLPSPSRLDLIVANAPYVPSALLTTLQPEVRREPALALDGGSNGLEVYRRLIPQAVRFLKTGGFLAIEHGDDQRSELERIFKAAGFVPEGFSDLAGKDRFMTGVKV